MTTYSATYSAEDNKLRLYASERLDDELFREAKELSFKWAPKQELFVAPKWTPAREDFCIKLAGTIEAEETTLVERAEAKAERLDNLSNKRAKESTGFAAAADSISQRFESGQPILVGHHSERKARKDKDAMERNMQKALECADAVNYWSYRAAGVERHANYKSNPRVRANRIKTLLKELREYQGHINHGYILLDIWSSMDKIEDAEKKTKHIGIYCGAQLNTGSATPWGWSSKLADGEMTEQEVIDGGIRYGEQLVNSLHNSRFISHILNRLGFENSELGKVSRFSGDLTPALIQAFAREHGALKPKATKNGDNWELKSAVPLPAHIAKGCELIIDDEGLRDLIQECGHTIIIKERRAPKKQGSGLINPTDEDAKKLQELWNIYALFAKYGKGDGAIIETTQAHYSANSKGDYGKFSTIKLESEAGKIWPSHRREKPEEICRVRTQYGSMYGADKLIIIKDKPQKELPFDLDDLIAKAKVKLAEHKNKDAT